MGIDKADNSNANITPTDTEYQIQQIATAIFKHKSKRQLSEANNWTQTLMLRMMENENFRVASLRFTDVAPTLQDDQIFTKLLSSHFKELDNNHTFIGKAIPTGKILSKIIAPLVRRNIREIGKTFIAGETLNDGIRTCEKFHNLDIACSLDLLGEAVITKKEAEDFTQNYQQAISQLALASKSWKQAKYPEKDNIGAIPRANISVKLSSLYEHIRTASHQDSKEVLCRKLRSLLDVAMQNEVFINLDMEHFEVLPLTMDIFETIIMEKKYLHYPHIGIVCQAYLKDSQHILKYLINLATQRKTPFSIRLVKGANWDYEVAHAEKTGWDCPVFIRKEDTDANFEKLTKQLLLAFPIIRPCIASHNVRSIAVAIHQANKLGLGKADIEFQVLYGMGEQFRNALTDMGYRVRQYSPLGEFISGMSYLVRRLLENTSNQSFLRAVSHNTNLKELLKPPQAEEKFPELKSLQNSHIFSNYPERDFSIPANREEAETALQDIKNSFPIIVEPQFADSKKSPISLLNSSRKKSPVAKQRQVNLCPWDTNLIVGDIGFANKKELSKAIKTAQQGLSNWQAKSIEDRAEILKKAAEITRKNWSELFALQVYEAGKDWVNADGDIAEGIDFMNYYACKAPKLNRAFQPESKLGEANQTIYRGRGVTAVIAPWNFPFAISAGMISAALVTGNTVIYKPAEQSSVIASRLYEIFIQAGVPSDALQLLTGKGEEIGAELVKHPQVATIAFTGSQEVGIEILNQANTLQKGQRLLKKCIVEMGGKNAIIIDSTADLDEAIPAIIYSAFGFQGQKCSACSRVIFTGENNYDIFLTRLKEAVEDIRVGNADNPLYEVNALIDKESYQKSQRYLRIGRKDGQVLAQASPHDGEGYFIEPIVFHKLKKDSKLTQEEVFAPLLSVYKAENLEEAVTMALDNDYALTGGIFSRDPQAIEYAKQHFRVGNLYINRSITGALVGRQPFGGNQLSGNGTKAGGEEYLLNFMEARTITENTTRRGFSPNL